MRLRVHRCNKGRRGQATDSENMKLDIERHAVSPPSFMFVAFDIRPTVAHLVRLRRQEEADAPYALASVTVLSIQRFLIGARTNLAHKPAAIVITAAVM